MFENVSLFGRGGKAAREAAEKTATKKAKAEAEGKDKEEEAEGGKDTEEATAAEDPAKTETAEAEAEDDFDEEAEDEEDDDMAAAESAEGALGEALAAVPKENRGAARNIAALAAVAATRRVAAIVRSPAAEGREEAAMTMALESDTSAQASVAVLGKLGKSGKKSGLADAMAAGKQPNLGPGGKSGASKTAGLSAAIDDINARNERG